jgi:ketosteroid isomerase-like protein
MRVMSRENVELVKALIPQGTDVIPLFRDEDNWARTREALSPLCSDDFQSVMVFSGQTPRTYAGLEGLRRNWLDWLEPWAAYRSNFDELIDVGDRVVILLRDHGRRKDMEIEVEVIGATILTFRGGKIARWEDYADRAEALEAAGMAEDVHASP